MVSICFLVCFTSLERLKILERENKYSSRHWSRQELSEQNRKNTKTSPASQNMGLLEIQTFYTLKEAISRVHREPTEWERTFTNYTMDRY